MQYDIEKPLPAYKRYHIFLWRSSLHAHMLTAVPQPVLDDLDVFRGLL